MTASMVIHPNESLKAVAVFQSFDEVFVTSSVPWPGFVETEQS
jgi:hypothetical protein